MVCKISEHYDRSPIKSIHDLKEEMLFSIINTAKREVLINLDEIFRKRSVRVIERKGNEINI